MKISIKGDNLTGDNFKKVIDQLNEDYGSLGVRVKNATCYIRFINQDDETVEVCDENGSPISREFSFRKVVKVKNQSDT